MIRIKVSNLMIMCLLFVPALQAAEEGPVLYEQHCAVCHQKDGTGLPPVYPSLVDNSFVAGQAEEVIRVLLTGRAAMPPFRTGLNSDQIAEVVSYIRRNWNNSPAVTPELVKQTMQDSGKGAQVGRETSF